MNTAQIYDKAIGRTQEESPQIEGEKKEEKEQRELRYLNYGMQQTSLEIKAEIQSRMRSLDAQMSKLVQREGTNYEINRCLLEKDTLQKVLNLIKTGEYRNANT